MADAVAHLQLRLRQDPQAIITFAELMEVTRCSNKSNFNRTIRNHPEFVQAREALGLREVYAEGAGHPYALQRTFGPIPGATYLGDV